MSFTGALGAVRDGDVERLRTFLDDDAKLGAKYRDGLAPRDSAARRRPGGAVKLLIKASAKTNAMSGAGETPLHPATEGRHGGEAELVAHERPNLSTENEDGEMALHHVAIDERSDVVELLVKGRSTAGAKNQDSKAPIHLAAEMATASDQGEGRGYDEQLSPFAVAGRHGWLKRLLAETSRGRAGHVYGLRRAVCRVVSGTQWRRGGEASCSWRHF